MAFQFEQFTVDTEQYRLCKSGVPVPIEPQVFDLLVYLIENRGRVVSRDELLDNLWKGKVVTDAALGARLKNARKAIGDSGARQAMIKTHHGRGYQFIARVSQAPAIDLAKNNKCQDKISGFTLPDKPSVAVLPFANLSDDPQQEFFADGITDEIITALSQVPEIFVIANNSTMTYKGRAVDVRQVGREQGVRYVLEGGIRKIGNQIRVTAQLIDATSGIHIWAERYQRELDNIFSVQEEITHNVVVELQVKLVTGERSRLWDTGTSSVEAWELIIRAKRLVESHALDNAMAAKQMALHAIELDPGYSTAWTILGWVYWEESIWGWSSDANESLQKATEAANKALEGESLYPGAYALLGHIHMSRDETEQAIAMSQKAVDAAPSDSSVLALFGNVLIESGCWKEGIQKLERALRLCPFPPVWYLSVLGAGYHLDGDNAAAIPTLEQAGEREPDSILALVWLASALIETAGEQQAQAVSDRILRIAPDFSARGWLEAFNSDAKSRDRIFKNLRAAGLPD